MNRLPGLRILVLALVLLAGTNAVHAQTLRTLTIDGGKVWVDGQALAPSSLPGSFDLTGISARFAFMSDVEPVFGLRGRVFQLAKDRLVELPVETAPVQINMDPSGPGLAAFGRTLPADHVQSDYLNQVQERDQSLYQMLVREAEAQNETIRLAQQIHQLPAGADRGKLTVELRMRVEDAFNLMQETRRREIDQIENRLKELKRTVDLREQKKDLIIDRRMADLIGRPE